MAISLAEIRQQCRERADMTDSDFIEDSDVNFLINSSIAELHDILIQIYEQDYYIKSVEFNTVNGQDRYDLDTIIPDGDFYKIRGVDAKLNGSDWFTLDNFRFNERNRFQNLGVWDFLGLTNVRYRLVGNELVFIPIPQGSNEFRIWYIPVATKLVSDTDELKDFNQYSEFVIEHTTMLMLRKEESDITANLANVQMLKQRITEAASNRDSANPESVTDIYVENNDYWYTRTGGSN